MPRPSSEFLTEREAQIMDVLWERKEATADEVRAALPGAPHDSSVRTLLRVLEQKGHVAHEVRGKAYVYRARVPRVRAQRTALRSVLTRFFAGSAEDLVLRLIEDEKLSPAQLEVVRKSVPPVRSPKRKGGSQ